MPQIISQHFSEILSFIAGALGGSFLTFTLTRNRADGSGTVVDQSRSRAGGDVVGGSKRTDARD